jgi:glycosyltransferase involved in cell wall biosynthesis
MKTKIKLVLLCNKPEKALKLAQKHGVAEQLILPGFQRNPYNWIQSAEALVLSSDYEGLPTVLLEAIALGTKVVSTACPHGPDEILTEELSRYLVPRRDPEALAKAIDEVLLKEIALDQASILGKVSSDKVAQQYLALAN